MGKRGPPKTPTHILKAVGSWRADEREGREPTPRRVRPKPQINTSVSEKKVFTQVCDLIKGMGLQAETDGNAIARYAKNIVLYNKLCDFCEKNGDSYAQYDHLPDGSKVIKGMKRFPQSQQRLEVEMMLLRLEREFGLTPAARASLQVEPSPVETAKELRYFG